MKKVLYITFGMLGAAALASCGDSFLETSSPSVVDADFVFSNTRTARAAMEGAYEQWRSTANSYVYGAGLFYAADIAGSDIERHPEAYANQLPRHQPEGFYENGKVCKTYKPTGYSSNNNSGAYVQLFGAIGMANTVIDAMAETEAVVSALETKEANGLSQLYGEAIALRATCYRELIKYYGDVPYVSKFGAAADGLASRDSIYDCILADLQLVEPVMFPVGQIPDVPSKNKNYFSQTYVDALIGRIALEAAGYQTRRSDLKYINGKGEEVQFEKLGQPNANADNAFYARRSDYMEYYKLAQTYFGEALKHMGSAKFVTVDPRSAANGAQFGNPYQYFFQQMMDDDANYADESIYEYPMQFNVTSDERTYSSGRANSGGGNTYPTKAYGQCRANPAYYYGMFDPMDMRRDVAFCVTGVKDGQEQLIPLSNGSQANAGGITLNKWDDNRMVLPNVKNQRRAGINGPYMRVSEVYLGYAEACAVLGNDGEARKYLDLIRNRAFPVGMANTDAFISQCGGLFKAIIEERGFEFAGEGDRRFTLIRTGLLPEAIKRIKDLTLKMINGLEQNGSYTFENGNVISDVVYTKKVDAKAVNGHRLTTQHLEDNDPILYPGWRGTHNDWASFGWKASTDLTNLAIQGLFKPVADAEALVADGYKAEAWGKTLVSLKDQYYDYLFTDYDYVSAPVYLWPICPNSVAAGGFTNGYGFKDTED